MAKAWAAVEKGDFAGARRSFAEVRTIEPNHGEAAYGMGYTTEKLGDKDSAVHFYCSAQSYAGSNKDLAREISGRLAVLGSDCSQ
jgi:Flp pilus assembly protein TadD